MQQGIARLPDRAAPLFGGQIKRQDRDHRLEWMIAGGGLAEVQEGVNKCVNKDMNKGMNKDINKGSIRSSRLPAVFEDRKA